MRPVLGQGKKVSLHDPSKKISRVCPKKSSNFFIKFFEKKAKKLELDTGYLRIYLEHVIFFGLGQVSKFSFLVLGQVATIHGIYQGFKKKILNFEFSEYWAQWSGLDIFDPGDIFTDIIQGENKMRRWIRICREN